MENISGSPTFGDFVTILTEGSMQDNTVARLQNTDAPLPLLFNVMYCVRISLRTVKIFLAQHCFVGNLNNIFLQKLRRMFQLAKCSNLQLPVPIMYGNID
jgi:hypothetical protein